MDFKNLKVTTESGFTCTFYEEEDGTQKVICFNGVEVVENKIVESSVGELKEGEPLEFRYYTGLFGSKTFKSETPIVSIEKIKED